MVQEYGGFNSCVVCVYHFSVEHIQYSSEFLENTM